MLSAILSNPGSIELREIETPRPSEGEVLVKIRASLTCGTDLKAFLRGHSLIPMPGPFGHEFSGIVTDKGKGVRKFKIGDPIMAVHSAPCLTCEYCRKGVFNLCRDIMQTKVLGAFAQYILLPRHIVSQNSYLKPEDLSFAEAAFLEPLACVVHGMDQINIGGDDTVFIIGAGPIGLLHLLFAKSRGARVLITGLEEERLKTAKLLGADLAFDPSKAVGCVKDFTGGVGADFVFECTGQPSIWESSVDYVRKGGTVVLFGGCRPGSKVRFDAGRLHYDEITVRGTFHFTPKDVRKAMLLLKGKKLRVKKLISATYALKDIGEAFQRLMKGEGIKYAIVP